MGLAQIQNLIVFRQINALIHLCLIFVKIIAAQETEVNALVVNPVDMDFRYVKMEGAEILVDKV